MNMHDCGEYRPWLASWRCVCVSRDWVLGDDGQTFAFHAGRPNATRLLRPARAELATKRTDHFRKMRKPGITVRKTLYMIIATFWTVNGRVFLFSDRHFLSMAEYQGLKKA
jgi:hypothetical protein